MKMMAIGIKGEVSHSKKFHFQRVIFAIMIELRLSIMTQQILKNIISQVIIPFITFFQMMSHYSEVTKINVLPIQRAKGLEFEKVAVIQSKMTENELYVAMSRALNSLILLD